MASRGPQHIISAACEEDLIKYGDSFRGVGYTKSPEEATERYALMLGLVREHHKPVTILDLGCGLGHLLDFIESHADYRHLRYVGLDISARYLAAARARHPQHEFILMDVLGGDEELPIFDYVVLNGVFNYRGPIDRTEMMRVLGAVDDDRLPALSARHGVQRDVHARRLGTRRSVPPSLRRRGGLRGKASEPALRRPS